MCGRMEDKQFREERGAERQGMEMRTTRMEGLRGGRVFCCSSISSHAFLNLLRLLISWMFKDVFSYFLIFIDVYSLISLRIKDALLLLFKIWLKYLLILGLILYFNLLASFLDVDA